jgi:hypothetical protein
MAEAAINGGRTDDIVEILLLAASTRCWPLQRSCCAALGVPVALPSSKYAVETLERTLNHRVLWCKVCFKF